MKKTLMVAVVAVVAGVLARAQAEGIGKHLGGSWDGEDWGLVVIKPGGTGTYTGTFNGRPGLFQFGSKNGDNRVFEGEWREDAPTEKGVPTRKGEFTLTVQGQGKIRVEWQSTDKNESRARGGSSTWTKK